MLRFSSFSFGIWWTACSCLVLKICIALFFFFFIILLIFWMVICVNTWQVSNQSFLSLLTTFVLVPFLVVYIIAFFYISINVPEWVVRLDFLLWLTNMFEDYKVLSLQLKCLIKVTLPSSYPNFSQWSTYQCTHLLLRKA